MFGLFTKIKSITTTELATHLRNNQIKEILDKVFNDLDKVFITESQYQ